MAQPIAGLHHITAFAADPQTNIDFYTQVLGQRYIKTTVNFDDPGTYHLYYADYVGTPGTVLTFFPWPMARRGRKGAGEVGAMAYTIPPTSVAYWKERLTQFEINFAEETRFGETVLVFPDPDGMMLELVAHQGEPAVQVWQNGPIPAEHVLQGFHGITIWARQTEGSSALLTQLFGYKLVGQEGQRTRFEARGALGQFVDILHRPDLGYGSAGAGTIHHVAFRTVDDAEQAEWQTMLAQAGLGVTEVRDRQYFHSIYFREPAGVLYEIATDGPGFAIDEPVELLGQSLKLPPWYEQHRPEIEKILPPVVHPEKVGQQQP